ncbi:fumarylacetoacetate hydrolase family protein, partial [Microbispora sp. NPDC049633]|uniref:fumarylacetoacetate hydrolase family protein n=1 Tax=Microbispora sp. NPDC049633 TaxID=3154355 RepID=UPI00342CEAB9
AASVLGYAAFNGLTARAAQKLTAQWTLGKNADRSGPMGPLATADEVGDLADGCARPSSARSTVREPSRPHRAADVAAFGEAASDGVADGLTGPAVDGGGEASAAGVAVFVAPTVVNTSTPVATATTVTTAAAA